MNNVPQKSGGIISFLDSLAPKEKRETISRDAKWTVIAIALVALIGQQITLKTLLPILTDIGSGGGASPEDYFKIIDVLRISLPFVVAITVLLIFIIKSQGKFPLPVLLGIGCIVLAAAAATGNEIGFKKVDIPYITGSYSQDLPNLLTAYLNAYGVIVFLSSFIVSIFFMRAYFTFTSTE